MDKAEFIKRAVRTHGRNYDYSMVEYKNCKIKVLIRCPKHGIFEQSPVKHLNGQGCPICAGNKKKTTESFINESRAVHGQKYDYSKVKYINADSKVLIRCPKHGYFEQTPYAHLSSCGCTECGKKLAPINRRQYGLDSFIKRAQDEHGNKYDYSKVEYINESTKVEIICKLHGSFWQTPYLHIKGQGCKECGYDSMSINLRHTEDSFIQEAKRRHNNKYDYSKVDYKGYFDPVEIICPRHGAFVQLPRDHLNYCGCQRCGSECLISKDQQEITDFIKENINEEVVINDRKTIYPYEIDIFIPSLNIGIEYNGVYWHSYDRKETRSEMVKHSEKVDIANKCGVELINIMGNQWKDNPKLLKSMLLNKLKLNSNKIYARNCLIKEVSNMAFKGFCDLNHINRSVPTNVKIGLFKGTELVAVMGFNRHFKYEWEISRLASTQNTTVIGGVSKMFNYFVKKYEPSSIMTYADRCYSSGGIYRKLGFKFVKKTKPNYKYVKSGVVYSRQQFQKHKLKRKISVFDERLTEAQNMFNNKFRRLWDCGNLKFLWIRA